MARSFPPLLIFFSFGLARFVYYLHAGAAGGAAGTLYGHEKGGDGRSLSSEQGASIRPADTSAQWTDHAVEEPLRAEPATCSNCEEPRELSWFFYGGGKRRVVVLDHMVNGESGGVRCRKFPKKSRGVFKPTKKVKTITKPDRTDRGAIEVAYAGPAPFKIEGVYVDPIVGKKLQILLESGLNILLDGPQGCGKTVLSRQVACMCK